MALLPFIDMPRLLEAVESKYPLLSEADAARNERGRDVLILSDSHESAYDQILTNFYSKKKGASTFTLSPKETDGLSGVVEKRDDYVPHEVLHYPLERKAMPDIEYDRSIRYETAFLLVDIYFTDKNMTVCTMICPSRLLTNLCF